MSLENVEIVRELIGGPELDATAPGVIEEFVDRLDPEVEFEEDPRFPEAGVYRGRDEVRRYFNHFSAEFETQVFTPEEVLDAGGDTVCVLLRIRGRGKGSGAAFDFKAGWVFTVRAGRVVRVKAFLDPQEARESVGLG